MDPKIRTVAVLGAGIMGNGISQTIAAAGPYLVYMVDVAQAILEQGLESIKKSLGRFTKKGEMTPEESEAIISRITPTTDFEVVQESDLVVEAIPEDLALKIETFQKLNDLCPTHAIMGTNTSSLPIASIAAATERPDMVIGIHFMNPVPVMKGVEVIKGLMTSPETVQATVNFVESIGKIPCLALDYAGFINSRLLSIYINEAVLAVMDGNPPEEVDKGMIHTANMPMGPLKLLDLIGLDVHLKIMDILRNEYGDRFLAAPLTRQMFRAGHLGRKTGRGFYQY